MTVVEDVFAKIEEIEAQIEYCHQMCMNASEDYWPVGDPGYTDFKAICLPISQDIVTLVAELNVLTSP